MKVLITGGAGFIGSNLSEHLIKNNYEVSIFDNLSSGKKENIPEGVKLIIGDVTNKADVEKLGKYDAVFHLAAEVSVPKSFENKEKTFSTNITGTKNIIDKFKDTKIVFTSSAAVFKENEKATNEGFDKMPMSPYAESKIVGEIISQGYRYDNSNISVIRPFNVYGKKQEAGSPYSGVIVKFIKLAKENKDIIVFGDGNQTRDFIHVSDLCSAFELAVGKNDTYNIGCGSETTVLELAEIIIEETRSNSKIIHEKERQGDIKYSLADISKAKNELKFNPKTSLEKGIEMLIHGE